MTRSVVVVTFTKETIPEKRNFKTYVTTRPKTRGKNKITARENIFPTSIHQMESVYTETISVGNNIFIMRVPGKAATHHKQFILKQMSYRL